MKHKIQDLPPFNVSVDGIVYADARTIKFSNDYRLPSNILLNIITNILKHEDEDYDVYFDNCSNGIVHLYVDDDELFESYNIELIQVG